VAFAGSEALAAALKRGQPEARAAFFDTYEPHARRILTHVLGPDPELTDVLHDSFVNAFRSVHTLRDPSALGAWFTRVTVFTARKVLRSRRRRAWLRLFKSDEHEAVWEPLAPDDVEKSHAVHAAYSALAKLPADEQLVFALHYVQGMTLNEVGAACELSLSTVKRRVKRARTAFLSGIDAGSLLAVLPEEEA
jgi:RNA polymerase sigma-70 factor (ECF subfamily)